MRVAKNVVVSLSYKLSLKTGELVQETEPGSPYTFLHGVGQNLPAFEKNIEGLGVGEMLEFVIPAAEGYGDYDPQFIVEIPKDVFATLPPDMLVVGGAIPMQGPDGHRMDGVITEVKESAVVMDFNNPLAGEDLHFKITILDLRFATPEEIAHGHVHGPEGHHH